MIIGGVHPLNHSCMRVSYIRLGMIRENAEAPVDAPLATPASVTKSGFWSACDVLCAVLQRFVGYAAGERDMVALQHIFEIESTSCDVRLASDQYEFSVLIICKGD